MKPLESMKALLTPAEYDVVAARLEAATTSVVVGTWLPRVSAVLVALKHEGAVAGWLVSSVTNKVEAEAAARDIAARLAADFEATRDAREAARLLIARIAR